MAVDLIFVESIDELAQSLDKFAAGALSHPELARSLIGRQGGPTGITFQRMVVAAVMR